jgi:parallel beta-helix repeat protein
VPPRMVRVRGGQAPTTASQDPDFYPEGTGDSITDNTISSHSDGIVVRGANPGAGGNDYPGASDFTISGNTITGSATDGIWVQDGSDGTITSNAASGSGTFDCQDSTSGTGTGGTADTWTDDIGSTSSPSALCSATGTGTPEFPFTPALPVAAFALIGGAVWLRRRRAAA